MRYWVVLTGALLCASCRPPRITPMTGDVAPPGTALPAYTLRDGHHLTTFQWKMNADGMEVRGDGVARTAAPDSARVDLFLRGLFGGGASAILLGDSTRTPPGARMTELIPSPPLLWAALGRLALPGLPDTIIRVAGDTLQATLGRPVVWRITAVGDNLQRVERVAGGRVVEFVERLAPQATERRVRYELVGKRTLQLTIENEQPARFEPSMWQYGN